MVVSIFWNVLRNSKMKYYDASFFLSFSAYISFDHNQLLMQVAQARFNPRGRSNSIWSIIKTT